MASSAGTSVAADDWASDCGEAEVTITGTLTEVTTRHPNGMEIAGLVLLAETPVYAVSIDGLSCIPHTDIQLNPSDPASAGKLRGMVGNRISVTALGVFESFLGQYVSDALATPTTMSLAPLQD
jgi:hypothetical protein